MATFPEIIEDPYPYQNLLGFEIVDWTEDKAVVHQPVKAHLGNRYGLPHGGVYASLLDTVMGFCGCFTGDPIDRKFAMTLSMNVSYLSRPRGELLIVEGRKIGGGQRTFFAEGEVKDETGELIAKGTGTFRYRSAKS